MIGVIIPYYKINFFEETLKSLADQTDKRFKVYIGDDASPEDPSDLLVKYKDKFDFVYHRFTENIGRESLTKQWERCIGLSNEEWLMILGDDDYLDPKVIESWYKKYEEFKEKSNVIRFATKIVLETSKTISEPYLHPIWETAGDSFVRIFKGKTRSSLSEYIFKREIYQKFGFTNYPLAWCADYMAWLDFPDKKMIYTINEVFVYFRISDFNISGQQDNSILKNEVTIQFFKDVILKHIHLFKKAQKLDLLMAYEVAIKKKKKLTKKEWLFLMKYYIICFEIVHFAKFIRRIFISIFKS